MCDAWLATPCACGTLAGPIAGECTPSCLCQTCCTTPHSVQVRPTGVQGGAIYAQYSSNIVTISATNFSNNTAVCRSCLAIVLQCPVLRLTDAMCCLACDTVCDTLAGPIDRECTPPCPCHTCAAYVWSPYAIDAMCCLACDTVCDTLAGPIGGECTPSCLCHTCATLCVECPMRLTPCAAWPATPCAMLLWRNP